MIKAYKTRINPTDEQIDIIERTFGVCRYVYNMYLHYNIQYYKENKKFITGYDFSKYLNNEFRAKNPDKKWITEVSSKAVKQSIMNGEKAFKNFFKEITKFPRFKKKNQNESFYLIGTIKVFRNKIQLPTLKKVQLCEMNYIPKNTKIINCTISKQAGFYYVSCIVDEDATKEMPNGDGIGIDLGLKEFAVVSNNKVYKNINKNSKIKKIERKLKREQRRLSRKLKKKGGNATHKNLDKQKIKVQKVYGRLANIRTDYLNKVVYDIAKTKPKYITIEDLNIKGMIKNRHLSKSIQQQKFYEFRTKLLNKCKEFNIELRIVDRFFPSSKTCSQCGSVKQVLQLKERVYKCECCGLIIDRDLNASINLKNADRYNIAQ